ncbi:MAG: hypothetical protein H6518_14890 [Microthrixaceae bacterium]|nr:hypothetical protein [Microthrixaceae bacterium]
MADARAGDRRVGVAHHYGWAVAVTADASHRVIDRRRIELIDPDLPAAPIHHEGGAHELHRTGDPLDDDALAALVSRVRDSVMRTSAAALDDLAADVGPIDSLSVRAWPDDLPVDIATLRRPPHESRADSAMYCQVLAALAEDRGWTVHRFDARTVEAQAAERLGDRADEVLRGPRKALGPPWAKDHRLALAATVLAG